MAEPLLVVEDLVKRFGGIIASDHLHLDVRRGEIHAVIGPNGAGKTSLIAQLCGMLAADAGAIRFDGHDITRATPAERVRLGLARSFQVTSVLPDFSCCDNVALAVQARAGHSFRFWRPARSDPRLRVEAERVLDGVGLGDRSATLAGDLAHGEQRQLEVAMAIATAPKMLLLDEPMAGMGRADGEWMTGYLARLKGEYAMLLVEHDMDAVFALADRITVLVYGRAIATGTPDEIRADKAVREAYLGGRLTVLEVEGIEVSYGNSQALFGMSLEVAAGEVVTLLGRNGMGKTTTVRAVMGILPPSAGAIRFAGHPIHGLPAYRVAQAGLGLVPEGRQIFPNLSVYENLIATASNRTGNADPWTIEKIFNLFPRLAERRRNMGDKLSGGEQQMLAIARALMTNPRMLILDEATEGLAPLIRDEIWRCLERLKSEHQAILLIDKNLDALLALAERHYIVEKGRVVWSGDSAALGAQPDIAERYLGV